MISSVLRELLHPTPIRLIEASTDARGLVPQPTSVTESTVHASRIPVGGFRRVESYRRCPLSGGPSEPGLGNCLDSPRKTSCIWSAATSMA
jgi:hypothetical protein